VRCHAYLYSIRVELVDWLSAEHNILACADQAIVILNPDDLGL
jgi:hypothetical protein